MIDSGWAYVNGEIIPRAEARISIFDRGFLFSDGIYEVSAVIEGCLVDNDLHLARLERSAAGIGLSLPVPVREIESIQKELIKKNQLVEGLLYLQVTRGVAERDFFVPEKAEPSLVMFTQERNLVSSPRGVNGVMVKTVPDERWTRRDIKSVGLLAQVLAKEAAREAGCQEAWMLDDNQMVTEGASSTAYIVVEDKIITRARSRLTLPGCTQRSLQRLIEENQLAYEERPFSLGEAMAADEAFITSASSLVTPVLAIDSTPVGDGRPGRLTSRLRELYISAALSPVEPVDHAE